MGRFSRVNPIIPPIESRVSHFTDTEPAGRVASAGIDVAEPRKGLDLVVLDRDRRILLSRGRLTVEQAARITLSMCPAVVCVDSPSGWSTSGRSRSAERRLARMGIQSYRTGPDPGDHPFYRWVRVGLEVFARLSATYPLYRGGAVAGTAAEIFPHASASLLAGALRSRDVPKHRFRRAILREPASPRSNSKRAIAWTRPSARSPG